MSQPDQPDSGPPKSAPVSAPVSAQVSAQVSVDELRLKAADKRLEAHFTDGVQFSYPAEFLRVLSPSAEVQGHGPSQRVTVPGKKDVGIASLELVGNYAVRIIFDDGHDTGIYSWALLRELGNAQDSKWQDYLNRLSTLNLQREP